MRRALNKIVPVFIIGLTAPYVNIIQPVYAREPVVINDVLKPLDFEYNGIDEVLLGQFDIADENDIALMDNYREYDTFKVYNQGITKTWNWLSNPYFIISIAKGASYQGSRTVSATISGSINGNVPSKAKNPIFQAFGISASGTKTISEEVKFSGPSGKARTRNFYYKRGTHRHAVKIVQEHRSNWDGLLWTKTYYGSVDVPAILSYSVDR